MKQVKKALLLVDVQNDFFPGGALAVKEGDQILPKINVLLQKPFDLIVASKDWHPKNHVSFASNHGKKTGETIDLKETKQILWPDHCVQGTSGAEFAPGWDRSKIQKIFFKGSEKEIDSYSSFFDNGHLKETGLAPFLKENGITTLYIAGLATDYCVAYSVRDALKLGFDTYVVIDACRAVNLHEGDEKRALDEMRALGAHLIKVQDLTLN